MTLAIIELVAACFFVASSGLFFNERFRNSRLLVLCAGLIALVSTYFLTEELIDRAISRRLASESEQPAQQQPALPVQEPRADPVAASAQALSDQSGALPEMVRIPGQNFEVGRYEVTFAQWDVCVAGGCNGYRPSDQGRGRGNLPVIYVSWSDAQAYVQWLSQRTGQRYRLLTSAEWEMAARAGTTTNFSWGDQDPVCDPRARNGANCESCTDDRTRPVGSFQPNGFGLYDVHGNVWEWVEDAEGSSRVLRGGSWNDELLSLRSANRLGRINPTFRDFVVGFRVARTV